MGCSVSELEANDGRICEISGSGSTEGHADKTQDFHPRIALCVDLEAPPKSIKPA